MRLRVHGCRGPYHEKKSLGFIVAKLYVDRIEGYLGIYYKISLQEVLVYYEDAFKLLDYPPSSCLKRAHFRVTLAKSGGPYLVPGL